MKWNKLLVCIFILIFTLPAGVCLGDDTNKFTNVMEKKTSLVSLSPAFLKDKCVYAIAENKFYRSRDGGSTWEQKDFTYSSVTYSDDKIGINDLLTNDEGFLFLYGYRSSQLHNLTEYFLMESNDCGATFNKITYSGDYRVVVTGKRNLIRIYDKSFWSSIDGGSKWQKLKEYSTSSIKAIQIQDNQKSVYMVYNPLNVLDADLYVDGVWKHMNFGSDSKIAKSKITCATGAPGGLMLVGTSNNYVLISRDYGKTWAITGEGITSSPSSIKCAATVDNVDIFAATAKGLFHIKYQPNAKPQTAAAAKSAIKFVIEKKSYSIDKLDKPMEAEPFIEQNRAFVPIKDLGEALGAKVTFNSATSTITIQNASTTVMLTLGTRKISINDQTKDIDVCPVIHDGRAYLPAAYVAEAFGYTVNWDAKTNTVNIY